MNITEFMSFDLEWFTTLPGLLITGGVIVLLIALIIFIISNKKADKKIEEETTSNDVATSNTSVNDELNSSMPAAPIVDNNMSAMSINVESAPMDFNPAETTTYTSRGSVNILGELPVEQPAIIPAPIVNDFNANNLNNPVMGNNTVDFTAVTPSTSVETVQPFVNESAPIVNTPVTSEPVVVAQSEPTPVASVETNVVEPIAQPEIVRQPEVKPTIYGGVNPINTVNASPVTNEVKPVIYGGANPLENTTTIPRITNHEAYNASANNVSELITQAAPIEPVQPQAPEVPVTMAPVQEPVQPQVVPVAPVEPAVVEFAVTQQIAQPEPAMPMTGEAMFGATDTSESSASSDASNEIETLEF